MQPPAASAERLRQSVSEQPFETRVGPLCVTLSLGAVIVVFCKMEMLGCEALLRAADEALYAAKAKGRNRIESAGLIVPVMQS